jgi:hypothetical protein
MTSPIRFPRPLRPSYGLVRVGLTTWKAHYYLDNRMKATRLTASTLEEAMAERDALYATLAERHGVPTPGPVSGEKGLRYRKPWSAWDGKTKVGEFDTMDEAKEALRQHKLSDLTV